MEKIAMKCTRLEFESIKQFVGELDAIDNARDFVWCNYLATDFNRVFMANKHYLDSDRKVYETFDKAIFLKACGVDPNKVLFENVTEYFKDAVDCVSVMGSKFNMKDYDLNSLHIDNGYVFIKNKNGEEDKWLYCLDTKQYAKIVTTTSKLKVSFNPSKNWLEEAIWSGGSSITPEILRELTEPKNEAKRFKVGGIYKGKETEKEYATLLKITSDDGIMISGYGFVNNKFIKNQKLYGSAKRLSAIERLQETTIEKWEKALLKYKK